MESFNMDTLDISSQIPMERQQTTNPVKMQWKLKRAISSQNTMENPVKIPCDSTPPRIHRAVGRVLSRHCPLSDGVSDEIIAESPQILK